MHAYYKTVEAQINDEVAMKIHVVYYEAVRGDGMTSGSVYKLIGVYDNEVTAKAVVNAIKGGLI